jgi:predicted CoA-binding protein
MDANERLEQVVRRSSDDQNPSAGRIAELMTSVEVVAVIGMSRDPAKAARRVPSYMAAKGYDVIPVNPFAARILGKIAYPELSEIAVPVDLVLIFRPSDQAGRFVVDAAARPEQPAIWLQEGIRADAEAKAARDAGLTVIQDLCFFQAHRAVAEGTLRSTSRTTPLE